jgi:hypothetical protein
MNGSKSITALSVAVVFGVLGAASAALASDHENQSGGFRYGPQGQVFGTSYSSGAGAYAATKPKPKPIHAGVAARAAHGADVGSHTALDALAVQHKDPGWDHRYQSWCDVDPSCNGWNKKMQEYEATLK